MKARLTVKKRWDTHPNGTDRFFIVESIPDEGDPAVQHFFISDIDEQEPYLLQALDRIPGSPSTVEFEANEWLFDRREHWTIDKQLRRQYRAILEVLWEKSNPLGEDALND